MAKYKRYDYSQQVLIPVSLQDQLIPGTLEFAIHTLVESRVDTSIFDDRYQNDETGRLAYDPKILLKIVLLGYSRGLVSSRKIERACRENVTFMALCCGQQPDHSTIATFVSCMKDEIMPLFRDVLLVCEEMKLLGGTFFALDGSKLPSNASKEYSGKHSDLNRKKEKIEKKVEQLLKEQEQSDKRDDDDGQGGPSSGLSNRKRQIERLQRKAERIEKFLTDKEPKIGRQGREIKSNITDNESANMMTSHGTIQGYNGQALVDKEKQVIVHAEAFGEGQDQHHIPPMLDGAKKNMKELGHGEDYFKEKILVADVNYHGPENLNRCDDEHLDAYIPDNDFRKRDPRFATQDRWRKKTKQFTLKDFQHNEAADEYICPQGKSLKRKAKRIIRDGIIARLYKADEGDCRHCKLRSQCLRGKKARRRSLSVPTGRVSGHLTKEMAEKIDTEKGRQIYHQRIAIVEPVFANIKSMKRLDRFTLRSKIKVNIQWVLYCMVHNIEKIANYGFT
ncbi:IS1182 family transposase [Thermodesulfobacteriota bacterium]